MSELERRLRVHLAGPDCSPEETEGMAGLAALLECGGFEVYLRSRHGIGSVLAPHTLPGDDPALERRYRAVLESAAFALEVFQVVRRCDCLVFNMNGRVPDDGGAFLAAVAFTAGKPVVLYKRDHRTKLYGNDNAMISGLSADFAPVREPARLPGEVEKAIGRCRQSNYRPGDLPPLVKLNVDLGREVWESLQRFNEPGSKTGPFALCEELAAVCEASDAYRLRA
ncbi:MAG: nucleoside 2-deoxyribosyltransferase [Actinobacteria bacterium]|nr:nucleoside 2-deoxyribosyltransferase [Actinomycetota bacterium]MBU2686184.1 nucleoside 2-deoxyribosyltransferase [Actinomycetota bacterium]